jgi:type II secretory pathway pseudopilin PulG
MTDGNRPRRQQTRAGKSLIELLVVISISGVLFGLVTFTLTFLLRVQANLEEAALVSRTLSRLSREFRRDVHAAPAAGVATPAPAADRKEDEPLPLTSLAYSPDRAVAYVFDKGDVVRLESFGGKTRRERYSLPRGSRCELRPFDPADGGSPKGLDLVVSIPPNVLTKSGRPVDSRTISAPAWRVHHIVAETGRHP